MKEDAKIKLISTDVTKLFQVCQEITDIAKRTDTKIKGPVPLPTKRIKLTMRKGPDGGGTAKWDRFEMRIHKRLIFLGPNDRAMRQIMRVQVPEGVQIGIEIPS